MCTLMKNVTNVFFYVLVSACILYFRFINGLDIPVNISTPKADFGLIEPLFYSNYTMIKNGK